jgi:DNA-binding NtrC family response regulator
MRAKIHGMTGAEHSRAHYRLRGEVGGASRSYPLRAGDNWIGSAGGNAVVLPLRGVSRRHALLRREGEGLTLEDLGSKNGTLVQGVRVQRTRLQLGDEIRVGPVTLRVEEVAPEDAALAIHLDASAGPIADGGGDTTATAVDEPGRIGLSVLEPLVVRACQGPAPELSALVTVLAHALGAESACLLDVREGEPVALAACGPLPDLASRCDFLDFVRAPADEGSTRAVSLEGPPALACAFTAGAAERSGLVVAGDLRYRASDVHAVLRVLLGVVQRLRPDIRAAASAPSAELPPLSFPDRYVTGDSPAMRSFYAEMRPLVQGDVPVLLLGETGVGKELLARILHDSSRRRRGPFVAVNCAAIPADLLEAELFGIGKGVATGVAERRGKFQMAEGGTLFLDEIGDMPLELQAKLLRALQEKEVQPVGGAPVPVDIRVIAATNSDLQRRMEEARFRRDLYFRIAGFVLRVPALRERREDVPALVECFVRTFARETGRRIHGVTVKALRALVAHEWPGNVRELEHEVRRLVYLCPEGQAIDSTMISPHVLAACAGRTPASGAGGAPAAAPDTLDLEANVDALERRLITGALEHAGGNRSYAARLLGISRNGLAFKIERLGLGRPSSGG